MLALLATYGAQPSSPTKPTTLGQMLDQSIELTNQAFRRCIPPNLSYMNATTNASRLSNPDCRQTSLELIQHFHLWTASNMMNQTDSSVLDEGRHCRTAIDKLYNPASGCSSKNMAIAAGSSLVFMGNRLGASSMTCGSEELGNCIKDVVELSHCEHGDLAREYQGLVAIGQNITSFREYIDYQFAIDCRELAAEDSNNLC